MTVDAGRGPAFDSAPDPEEPSAREEHLRRVQVVTDAALSHLDLEDLLDDLLERVREILDVDTAAILLLDDFGSQLVATAARGLEEEVRQGVRIPVGVGFAGRIAATKAPVVLDHVDHTNVANPLLRSRGIRSLLGVPLIQEGAVLGVMHVGTCEPRIFTAEDTELLQLVADRAALAAQVRLAHLDRSTGRTLQRNLLPGNLPAMAGLDLAVRYVAGEVAGEGGLVGGDWYDAFPLPDGRPCLVIGDVVGRGLRAAIVMSRLRSTLRAYALSTNGDPAGILAQVDRDVLHFEDGAMATVIVGVFDPPLDRIVLSSAGHPPPVLVDAGGAASMVDLPADPLLGMGTTLTRQNTLVEVPVGGTLCFYTDGLVERRGTTIDDGLGRLQTTLTTATSAEGVTPATADLARVCASVMDALSDAGPVDDDIALLLARRADITTELTMQVPAKAASLHLLRVGIRRWLVNIGASQDDAQDLLIGISEALSNAVEHAYGRPAGPVELRLAVDAGTVTATVRDWGRWRTESTPGRGRGLRMMGVVADQVEVDPTPGGTTVTLTRGLRGP